MSNITKREPAVILLVEDDPGDQVLTQEAFKTLHVPHHLHCVGDGKEALEYLYHKGDYEQGAEAPRPDLILLDLNMPRVTGQQVAAVLHADPQLRSIPIVVLTTSRRQEDVLRAYSQGVTGYIGKPLDFEDLLTAVRDLESLIKLVVALKSLPARSRLTDRHVSRLARRMQQMERRAEQLFDHYMAQIGACSSPPETAGGGEGGKPNSRLQMLQIARKILGDRPAAAGASPVQPGAPPVQQSRDAEGRTPGLYNLARRLADLDRKRGPYAETPGSREDGARGPR